ncbi:DUF3558 domain-containing protein [Glycomyces sp. TRM65418]|uniref:DUF3558 family protein n=1 Tax=Glycomyces sp. TRM65418 TaxID=2867006 RepID=UPI001CE5DF61|nr:DUF3558 family protein [Glycomyces sp. TRM65418]MCC3761795.1 DUF3558 domain-containing protein [Glycomyces sp. TRM65418]QZD55879.1 DUF3558 domain-containing protein [Glycomyces sp. TRM65418]
MRLSSARRETGGLRRAAGIASAVLLGLAITGCGSDDEDPAAGGSRAPSASGESAEPDATPTPEPVTLEELAEDPCTAIDDMDAFALGLTDPEPSEGDSGKSCNWETRDGVSAGIVVHLSESAETVAEDWEDGRDTDAAIDGYTVIQEEFQAICFTVVATRPDQSILITTIGGEEHQSTLCPLGTAFAERALAHLETGG